MSIAMRWPCDYRRKAEAVAPVERAALSGIAYVRIAQEDTNALRQRAAVPCHVLHHVPWQKTNATAIDAIVYPDGCNRHLLLPLHQSLHLPKAHNDILRHHLPAVEVLLTGAPLIAKLRPINLHNNARRMVQLLGNWNVRGRRLLFGVLLGCLSQQLVRPHHGNTCTWTRQHWALIMDDGATHCARHRSQLVLGKGAGAAPPEAARGGGYGVSCLCYVSALGIFFELTHTS